MEHQCKSPYCKEGFIKLYEYGMSYYVECPECEDRKIEETNYQENPAVVLLADCAT